MFMRKIDVMTDTEVQLGKFTQSFKFTVQTSSHWFITDVATIRTTEVLVATTREIPRQSQALEMDRRIYIITKTQETSK